MLVADAPEDPRQLAHQLHFARSARGEVGMPSLGGARHEPPLDVVEQRLAEPRPGRDHRRVAAGNRHAVLERVQLVRLQHGDAIGEGFEIVQHAHAPEIQRLRDRRAVHPPRYVGQARDLFGHRAGHAQARRLDLRESPRRAP